MTLNWVKSRESLFEQDIVNLETQFKISLPAPYRDFLLLHNGGQPTLTKFPLQNNPSDTHAYIEYFFCIKDNDIYNLAVWVRRFKSRIPYDLIPIAIDLGGNLICLSVIGERIGKVYFWDHEEEVGEGKEPWGKNLYFIANNFTEFLENLAY
jgi:hypothetical protein